MVAKVISGGEGLTKYLADLSAKVTKASTVSVGFMSDATYPDLTPVAMVAAIQNFGAPAQGIPPRPFFSNMVKDKAPGWGPALAMNLEATDYDAAKALGRVGLGIEGQLAQSIVDTFSPPLSALTLAIRAWKSAHPDEAVTGSLVGRLAAQMREADKYGPLDVSGVSAKPLVDTGHMLASITSRVT